jgi:hypothetical protein
VASVIFHALAEGHYHMADPGRGIEFDVRRLHYERHELLGELSVSCGIAGARVIDDGILSVGSFNFSSTRARTERGKILARQGRTNGQVDWDLLLEELCHRVIGAERRGRPALPLRDVPRSTTERVFHIDGLPLLRDHPIILFGDGATAKSYLALHIAGELALRGEVVLYGDWELSGDEHRDRYERIHGRDDMPASLLYVRCDRPLVYEIDRLARLRQQHSATYVICDSISFACDGPPEAAEVAGRYFQAVRQLGVGSLHLAHTNRSERAEEKPFGSAFWHNGARATWFVKRSDEASGSSILIGLFNKKANLGRLMPSVGFRITFGEERTTFQRTNLADDAEMAVHLPLRERICHALRGGPQPLYRLAEELEAKVETVERIIRRHKHLFTRVIREDGVHQIALVERRSA